MVDAKENVLDALGRVSGIGGPEMGEIFLRVRANSKRLESCVRHNFIGIPGQELGTCKDGTVIYRRFRCLTCEGEADSINVSWYNKGRKHGMGGG